MKIFKLLTISMFLMFFAGAGAQADISQGLISYYPFEGDSNDVVSGNDGFSEGGVTYEGGALGLAARFDGDGEIVVDTAPGLSEWTISLWVYIDTLPIPNHTYCVISKFPPDTPDAVNYGLNYAFNRLPLWRYKGCNTGAVSTLTPGSQVVPRYWHHITSTLDGMGNHRFFLNGALRTQLFNQVQPCENQAPMTIGGMNGLLSQMFKGMVDELRIYDRALTPQEVNEVYGHDDVYVLESPEPECPEPDFIALMEAEVARLGLDYGATGAVHVYPNLLKPNRRGDHMRTVVLKGHIASKLSALKYDTPDVIRAAYVMIGGERHDVVLDKALGFEQAVEVLAVPGTELPVTLIAVAIGDQGSVVDETRIQVPGQHPCDRLEKLENRVVELQEEKVKLKKKYRWYHRIKTARIDKRISWLNRKIASTAEFCESVK